MKRINITLLALMLIGILFSCTKASLNYTQNGNWVTRAAFPGVPMGFGASFVIGTDAYVGTGINPLDATNRLTTFFKYTASTIPQSSPTGYDSAFGIWTQVAPFAGPQRSNAIGFTVAGKGYVGTGLAQDGFTPLADVWSYDPGANSWAFVDSIHDANGTFHVYDAAAFSFDTVAYVLTGTDRNYYFPDVWKFSPATNSFTRLPYTIGAGRSGALTWVYNGKGYLLTGYSPGSSTALNNMAYDFWLFDPAKAESDPTHSWSRLRDISNTNSGTYDDGYTNIVRQNGTGFVIRGTSSGDKGYVTLGQNGTALNFTWEYDFASDLWTEKTPYEGTARSGAQGFTIRVANQDRGFICTGLSSGNQSGFLDCREFFPNQIYNQFD
jgi:N-acetylneuraminic acid mutarotase